MSDRVPQLKNDLTVEQRALWQKLAAFALDADSAVKPFSVRLAAENGWPKEFAQRVIAEYRRFLFLTAVAGHVVCPSEEVDAVWHQHLTFSRSYWNDLCHETLGYPLHHDPATGGPDECRKHWDMYRETLVSYRRVFGEEPPHDVWPMPLERFDPRSQSRAINLRDHWILRKPGWWPRWSRRRLGLTASLFPIAAVGLGPFDLAGHDFLAMFFSLFAFSFVACFIYRRVQRDVPVTDRRRLSHEEIACLTFGRPAAVNATVAGMLHLKELDLVPCKGLFGQTNGSGIKFAPGRTAPLNDPSLASTIYRAVQEKELTLIELQHAMESQTEAIDEELRSMGYLVDAERTRSARLISGIVAFGLLALGTTKIMIGLDRGRPVGFLIFGCIAVVITFLVTFASVRRSLAGDRMIELLRSQYNGLRSGLQLSDCSADKILLGTALFGAAALEGTPFKDLKSAWKSTSGNGTGNSSGGCGTGTGCGGGCGHLGGAGCGGGGCGGCSG